MATASKTSPDIDPEGQYRLVHARKVVLGDIKLLPRHDNIVSGTLLIQILDQVDGYEKID